MRYPASLLAALVLAAAACGGDDDGGNDDASGAPTTAGSAATTVDVIMGDNFFDPDVFSLPAGVTVTINTPNEGLLIHNLRIAGPDGEYNTEDDAAHDDYIRGGDAGSLQWDVPDEPGDYKFRCDIHPDDMTGVITVE